MIVTIPGRFASLNEFIAANRRRHGNWSAGNAMKQKDQDIILRHIPQAKFKKVELSYHFYEPNSRRDMDNVSGYFRKIFQDALVQAGCLKGDGWKYIAPITVERFSVDVRYPRIEVEITEV